MAAYNSNEWSDWMAAALAGDKVQYQKLLFELRDWLMAYFKKRVHASIVEDLVQETLLSLHKKRDTYDITQPFGPWIAAIARYRWIDHLRQTMKYVEMELNEEALPGVRDPDVSAKHDVKKLLQLLPAEQAELIAMAKINEMTMDEISQRTGRSVTSIKVQIHRGIKKLKSGIEVIESE